MKRSPCVPHSHADEIRAQKKEMERPTVRGRDRERMMEAHSGGTRESEADLKQS